GPVEAFDVGVLVGLAWLDVPDGHAVELGPLHEGLAQELRAVVGAQDLRQAVVALELLEDADQARGGDRGVDLDVQRLAVEVVDYVEGPEATATGQRIGHEVGRPDGVWQTRHVQRHAFALGQALLGLATQVELHGLVHPVDSLVVPVRPSTAQDLAALPEAARRTTLDLPGQCRDDLCVAHGPMQRRLIPGRTRQPDAITGPAQGPRVHLDQVPHGLALLLRPYSFFAIRSFIAALSSASSAYIRLSLAFSASRSLTRRSSEASRPPYF